MSMCVFRLIPDTTNLDEPYQNQYKMNQTASLRSDTRPETTGTTGRNQSERPTAINRNDRPQTSEYATLILAKPGHNNDTITSVRDGTPRLFQQRLPRLSKPNRIPMSKKARRERKPLHLNYPIVPMLCRTPGLTFSCNCLRHIELLLSLSVRFQ